MRILLFGPPGVGKGTHAKRLARELGVPHVATGDLLREVIASGSDLGRQAAALMGRGELVPDEAVVEILEQRLEEPDAAGGYLLDGFPRTLPQAEALERKLTGHGVRIDAVLCFDAPEDMLVNRIAGRLSCPSCGSAYNRFYRPPRAEGLCDQCGAVLTHRADDNETTVRRRLHEYRAKTAPVIAFFRTRQWPISEIDAVGEVDEIFGRVRRAMARR
jgi:adenylate kinase